MVGREQLPDENVDGVDAVGVACECASVHGHDHVCRDCGQGRSSCTDARSTRAQEQPSQSVPAHTAQLQHRAGASSKPQVVVVSRCVLQHRRKLAACSTINLQRSMLSFWDTAAFDVASCSSRTDTDEGGSAMSNIARRRLWRLRLCPRVV